MYYMIVLSPVSLLEIVKCDGLVSKQVDLIFRNEDAWEEAPWILEASFACRADLLFQKYKPP